MNKENLIHKFLPKQTRHLQNFRSNPINQAINHPYDVTQGIQRGTKIETGKQTAHKVQTACITD